MFIWATTWFNSCLYIFFLCRLSTRTPPKSIGGLRSAGFSMQKRVLPKPSKSKTWCVDTLRGRRRHRATTLVHWVTASYLSFENFSFPNPPHLPPDLSTSLQGSEIGIRTAPGREWWPPEWMLWPFHCQYFLNQYLIILPTEPLASRGNAVGVGTMQAALRCAADEMVNDPLYFKETSDQYRTLAIHWSQD